MLRPVPDNTQHSQETDIQALGGIRTHNPASGRPQSHALDWATEYAVNQILTISSSRYLKLKQKPNIVQSFITSACGGQRMLQVLT